MHRHAALLDGVLDDLHRPFTMVQCRITRLKALPRRSDVCVPDIGEYGGRAVNVVFDNSRTDLVR